VRAHKWDLSSETVKASFDNFIAQMRLSGKRPVVQLVPENRSLDQNDMFYALYQQVAEQKDDESIRDVRRYCKLHFGVPILRASVPGFKAMYDKAIRDHLEYEEKLEAMDFLPVTRLMTKKQGTEYIDTIIREFSKQGYSLIHPSEAASYA
jgi:hypothetical protein